MLKKIALGELLVKKKLITQEQLETAKKESKKSGTKLLKTLGVLGFIPEDTMLTLLSQQLKIPFYDLRRHQIDFELVKLLSETYARRFHALVLKEHKDGYLVGVSDPLDMRTIDELKRVLKKPIYLALVRDGNLTLALNIAYQHGEAITGLAEELQEELGEGIKIADLSIEQGQVDAPVIKLLQTLFEDAIQLNASDIHIEPGDKALLIRTRVDGVLNEQVVEEKGIAAAITLRLKLMAGLDISEKRLPQDGHFFIKVHDRYIDVRLSTLATQYGESTVMRLLDQSASFLTLEQLGMPEEVLVRVRKLIKLPNGVFLITGPTGSGKTTTLYAMLNILNTPERKIITAEDPVEYRMPRVNQVQILEKLDFTFARILRSMLRQDPDIIMVGEMRDFGTADIAMRAALTGHFVLSSLHTNDAASTALRLLDMNVDGYLIGASLRGVLAQRLVRRICDVCKEEYVPAGDEKIWLEAVSGSGDIFKNKFHHGKGCTYCNSTGYKGRVGIFELLELDQPMIDALRSNQPGTFAKLAADYLKGRLLLNKGLELVLQGITTINEIIRVAGDI